jgi:hypothetical protein
VPALAAGLTVADVERDRDPVRAVGRHETCGKVGVAKGRRPDDDAGSTPVEHLGDRVGRAQSAGDLDTDGRVHGGDDRFDGLAVDRRTRPSRVEIDDVEPRRAFRREVPRHGPWVVAVRSFTAEVALLEPHDSPAAEVDRGEQLEVACHGRITVLAL